MVQDPASLQKDTSEVHAVTKVVAPAIRVRALPARCARSVAHYDSQFDAPLSVLPVTGPFGSLIGLGVWGQ